jgi:ComF family protein
LNWKVEIVVPVPLGVARLENRGYNQAALLARPLALATLLRYEPDALIRSKETLTQVGLSVSRRRVNVKGAFEAKQRLVEGKSVLIVDDIATSGATLEACAEAMFNSGARAVYCLTLARTL